MAETPTLAGLLAAEGHPIGEVSLTRDEIGRRVAELGAELADAYAGREPLLVAPLKSSTVFLADLSRALPVPHGLDFLELTLSLRSPASLSAVTLLDRPYRRLVDDVPLDYVGFTVPDELFAGYGLGIDERWRPLPDLHVVTVEELPAHLAGDNLRAPSREAA